MRLAPSASSACMVARSACKARSGLHGDSFSTACSLCCVSKCTRQAGSGLPRGRVAAGARSLHPAPHLSARMWQQHGQAHRQTRGASERESRRCVAKGLGSRTGQGGARARLRAAKLAGVQQQALAPQVAARVQPHSPACSPKPPSHQARRPTHLRARLPGAGVASLTTDVPQDDAGHEADRLRGQLACPIQSIPELEPGLRGVAAAREHCVSGHGPSPQHALLHVSPGPHRRAPSAWAASAGRTERQCTRSPRCPPGLTPRRAARAAPRAARSPPLPPPLPPRRGAQRRPCAGTARLGARAALTALRLPPALVSHVACAARGPYKGQRQPRQEVPSARTALPLGPAGRMPAGRMPRGLPSICSTRLHAHPASTALDPTHHYCSPAAVPRTIRCMQFAPRATSNAAMPRKICSMQIAPRGTAGQIQVPNLDGAPSSMSSPP